MIAVATQKGIAIWHVGANPELDGSLSVEKVALLSGHGGEVFVFNFIYNSHSIRNSFKM